MKSNKAFTRWELLVIIVIVTIITICIYWISLFHATQSKSQKEGCKNNLRILKEAINIYVAIHGNGYYLPDTNGGGFLARIYQRKTNDIVEYKTEETLQIKHYRCPGTQDKVSDYKLRNLLAEDDDKTNAISYMGRKNKEQRKYPGLFWVKENEMTVMASDDFQGTPNHSNGKEVIILYWSGRTEILKEPSAKENDYAIYANKTGWSSLDPLTN